MGNVSLAAPPPQAQASRLSREWIGPHGRVHDTPWLIGATLLPWCSLWWRLAGNPMDESFGEGLRAALRAVAPLADRFTEAGHHLYLVGGVVRDDLLNRERDDGDYDLTTDARPDVIRSLLDGVVDAVWLQGERFGTIGCRRGDREYEITTHRSDVYHPESRKPEVVFGDRIEVDLSRRDFTVNAMAVDAVSGELLDPFGGLEDLRCRRLRTPSGPELSFADDPLRMVRAARFVATLGLVPDPDLVRAAGELRARLGIVAVERIRDELDKMLTLSEPADGFAFLAQTGLLSEILPEMATVGADRVGARLSQVEGRLLTRWAALLAELPGAEAREALGRLKPSGRLAAEVAWLLQVAAWSGPADVPATAPDLRRLAASSPEGLSITGLLAFAADLHTHPVWLQGPTELAEELERQEPDLHRPAPPLTGDHIGSLLGVPPGPIIGEAHRILMAHRFDSGPMRADEAEQLLRVWWERTNHRD